MKRMIAWGILLVFALSLFAACKTAEPERFAYVHDPTKNPEAMKDIVVNPDAVYGFSPSPESTRLKDYVDAIDWTDPVQVAEGSLLRPSRKKTPCR